MVGNLGDGGNHHIDRPRLFPNRSQFGGDRTGSLGKRSHRGFHRAKVFPTIPGEPGGFASLMAHRFNGSGQLLACCRNLLYRRRDLIKTRIESLNRGILLGGRGSDLGGGGVDSNRRHLYLTD